MSWTASLTDEEWEAYLRDQSIALLAARIGPSFGRRQLPRVRRRRTGRGQLKLSRAFRTKRAAFRWARNYRARFPGSFLAVWSEAPLPRRKLRRWFVGIRVSRG